MRKKLKNYIKRPLRNELNPLYWTFWKKSNTRGIIKPGIGNGLTWEKCNGTILSV
jgi:hypothetical protein